MKKNLIVLFFLLSIVYVTNGQDVKLTKGELQKIKTHTQFLGFEKVGNKIWSLESKGSKLIAKVYSVDKLNLNKKFVLSDVLSVNNPGKYKFNAIMSIGKSSYIFFEYYNRSSETLGLYGQKIDDNGELDGSIKLISSIKSKSKRNSGSFELIRSQDKNNVLIFKSLPGGKNDKEKFAFKIVDADLKEKHAKGIEFPYKGKNFNVDEVVLGNNGMIYMMCKVSLESKKKKRGSSKYYYNLVTYDHTSGDIKNFNIELDKKHVTTVSIKYDHQFNSIVCAGMYGNIKASKYEAKDVDGFFYLRLGQGNQIVNKSVKQFSKDIISRLNIVSRNKKSKKGKGIEMTFELDHLHLKKDGSATLIAENRWVNAITYQTTTSNGMTNTVVVYHYFNANILCINIDADGNIVSFKDIPKMQHSVDDEGKYNSYLFLSKGDNGYFLFNERKAFLNKTELSRKDMKKWTIKKDILFNSVRLPEGGAIKKEPIFTYKEAKTLPIVYKKIEINNGKYIILYEREARYAAKFLFGELIRIKSRMSGLIRVEI